jgi:hypothetical protein
MLAGGVGKEENAEELEVAEVSQRSTGFDEFRVLSCSD